MNHPVETPIEELLRGSAMADGWETVSERGEGVLLEVRHHGDLHDRAADLIESLRAELGAYKRQNREFDILNSDLIDRAESAERECERFTDKWNDACDRGESLEAENAALREVVEKADQLAALALEICDRHDLREVLDDYDEARAAVGKAGGD